MATLSTLERRLVRERTEVGVARVVDRFFLGWDRALVQGSSLPDPLDFVPSLVQAGFYLPTSHRALQYLTRCHRTALTPHRGRLLRLLVPSKNALCAGIQDSPPR